MGILSSLFKSKGQPISSEIQKPMKKNASIESVLANLAMEVVGSSSRTSLMSFRDKDILDREYGKLVNLGLVNSANARLIKSQLDSINEYNKNIENARKLVSYLKRLNQKYGDKVILVSREAFYDVCERYDLEVGPLTEYTGVIPAKNLEELFKVGRGDYGLYTNYRIYRIIGVRNYSSISDYKIEKYLAKNHYIFITDCYMGTLDKVPSYKEIFGYGGNSVYFELYEHNVDEFFIACPEKYLKGHKVNISSSPVDPIIYRYCPYGIVIYTMWGDEAEDKVFEEYKKLNNLV